MKRHVLAASALALVAACDVGSWAEVEDRIANTDLIAETQRAFAAAYQDQPFEDGTVWAVAEEHGDLHTYSLTLCHGRTRVCGGGGGVGTLQQTQDFDIVAGAYRGRTFYLSPGGDGYLLWRGQRHPLAWD